MSPRGRRALQPAAESKTPRGLMAGGEGRVVVRCYDQQDRTHRDYDFTDLGLAPALRDGLAAAFERRTAPGSGLTSHHSNNKAYQAVVNFARHLVLMPCPPTEMALLAPEHLDGFQAGRSHLSSHINELGHVKKLLTKAEGLTGDMAGKIRSAGPAGSPGEPKQSYSREEFKRMAEAARRDLRAAATRIRAHREELRRLRVGELDAAADRHLARRFELMDRIDRFGDVPRTPPIKSGKTIGKVFQQPWVQDHGGVPHVMSWFYPTAHEVAAGAVLLAVLTGENPGVIQRTPAVHHRADGYTSDLGTAIVDLNKRRRGSRAHMTLALSEIPDWISVPEDPENLSSRDMLHTPFGVYLLLHELTSRARELSGISRLLTGYSDRGGRGYGGGFRSLGVGGHQVRFWGERHGLQADRTGDDGEQPRPLWVTLELLRLTYLELHQRPVAHTRRTFFDDYLGRNRGNLTEYRKVVASTLAGEVAKARTRGAMTLLSEQDLQAALADPEEVAAEHGLDVTTLKRMISGELDTVMNACADNHNSAHAPAGEPCRASFMTCLECPCARALPRHLPVQVLVSDRLAERRVQVTPMQWAQRFAGPFAQLADILDQHDDTAVADARNAVTDADRKLVERFLGRELDL
ncbi:hypothetical protein [Embleya sp. NPDC059237]|uniref:hypothetical protein n=1 Tax=Embleya sp. NPDC059237 TaxID=3346784 RepID=UPI0036B2B66F